MKELPDHNFGVEIECNAFSGSIDDTLDSFNHNGIESVDEESMDYDDEGRYRYSKWVIKEDGSLEEGGIEIVSPILSGESGIEQVKKVCKILNSRGNATVDRSCGLHVHVSIKNMTGQQIFNILNRYNNFEEIIDGWMAPSRREDINEYCESMQDTIGFLKSEIEYNSNTNFKPRWLGNNAPRRHVKLNACSIIQHETLEFRHHQGTTNFTKISNWIRFCIDFVNLSKDLKDSNVPLFYGMDPELKEYYKNRFIELSPNTPFPPLEAF